MKRLNQLVLLAGTAVALSLSTGQLAAQQGGGRGNFDPEQMRQRMMERVKEQLEVKNDDEWKVLEPLVQKTMDARRDVQMGGMGRMFGRGNRGGGAGGADQADQGNRRRFGPEPSAEETALQKAIDAKASKEELKSAMAKYREAHKAKETKLQAAQDDLRKVLTVRQEAIAMANGWLN
jgi:predicted Holliday junction resolvase-like endonuclease